MVKDEGMIPNQFTGGDAAVSGASIFGRLSLKQRVFRRITSIAWVSSTGFIPAKMKLWHKLCDNYNPLRIRKIHLWHKLCHKLRTHWLSMPIAHRWKSFHTSWV